MEQLPLSNTLFITILSFIFGTIAGSFLYAAVYRLQHNLSIIKGRSACPHCHHTLGVLDLIPLLSYIFLRGKCRYCHKKIPPIYIFFEIGCGILFVLAGLSLNAQWENIVYATSYMQLLLGAWAYIFLFLLVSIFLFFAVYDYQYRLVPNKVVLPLSYIFIGFLFLQFLLSFVITHHVQWESLNHLGAGLGAFLFFFIIVIVTKEKGMGWGDVKLALLMGLILGFPGIVIALYVSFIVGACYGVILLLQKKAKLGYAIPFAPFLSLGSIIFLLYGDILIKEFFRYLIF